MKRTWKKRLLYGSVIVVGVILAYILIETIRAKNTGFETKTLWDWMELLIIPLVLASGALYLNRSERAVERKIADDRAKLEREIATDRQQEAALQAYLDRMADLLLNENLRVSENEEVRNVARIRTLTVLRGLDAKRKGIVLRFLQESDHISGAPTIDLAGADLTEVDVTGANLRRVNLSKTDLSNAILSHVDLGDAYLSEAYMPRANLTFAHLGDASLRLANLEGADLRRAILRRTNLSEAHLEAAVLTYAELGGADLSKANLRGATVTDEQLATAKSIKGAIMPDGTKHD
jgi:uncharacterized protein YjbI with pentapeptide repeats